MNIRPLIPGCNYHTNWQEDKAMRFVLGKVSRSGSRVLLYTRRTRNSFWANASDLIFIRTRYNLEKGKRLARRAKDDFKILKRAKSA